MHHYGFLILLLCYNVLCISEECLTYNFEENQKLNFTNTYGICQGMSSWDVGEYSSLSIDSPHTDSNVFISPRTSLSCISSFKFSITGSGILELNVYMAPAAKSDQITLLVFQSLPGANDATVGNAVLSPNDVSFVAGWQTMRVHIVGIGTHEGYITLLGMASETSIVLVDSFRYVAPTFDIDKCIIYPDDVSTTEIVTEETTITPTTYSTSTSATEIPPTIPVTNTPEKPSTIISIPTTSITEIPTTVPVTTVTDEPVTITIPTISTTEKPTTTTVPITSTTEKPSTATIPTISTSEKPITTTQPITSTTAKPSTVTIPTISTTEKPSTITLPTISTTDETTTKVTSPSSSSTVTTSPSTERPRLFVSVLLIKIKKFFR